MIDLKTKALEHLNRVLAQHDGIKHKAFYTGEYAVATRDGQIITSSKNITYLTQEEISSFKAAALFAINRITGETSDFSRLAKQAIDKYSENPRSIHIVGELYGLIKTLKAEVEADSLISFTEFVHADMFSNFLEMAEYLRDEGYLDSTVTMGGGVLEQHLRELANKNNISLIGNNGKPKTGGPLNDDLAGAGIYSRVDHKQIMTWQGMRNDAAHGHYGNYDEAQVTRFLEGIADFIRKYPA